jgi:hypothetical protein
MKIVSFIFSKLSENLLTLAIYQHKKNCISFSKPFLFWEFFVQYNLLMIRIGNFLENFKDLFYDKNKNLERNKISLQTLKINLKFEILEIEGIFQRFFRCFCINFPASSQFFLEIMLKREIKESEISRSVFP